MIRKELSTKGASTHVKKPDALFQARRENVEGDIIPTAPVNISGTKRGRSTILSVIAIVDKPNSGSKDGRFEIITGSYPAPIFPGFVRR